MPNYLYAITLKTLIGERYGELLLDRLHGTFSGSMALLGVQHPVTGEIGPGGQGKMCGTLQTLIRRLPFTADGNISPERLELNLICGNKKYAIYGKRKEG